MLSNVIVSPSLDTNFFLAARASSLCEENLNTMNNMNNYTHHEAIDRL